MNDLNREPSSVRWFQSYGVFYGMDIPDVCGEAVVSQVLPPRTEAADPTPHAPIFRLVEAPKEERGEYDLAWTVYRGGEPVSRTSLKNEAVNHLESAIALEVSEFSTHWAFVHAGVVRWHNHVIVIPGMSFAGKTTLVHGFVEAGAEYFSDEYALIAPDGSVAPYPRLLSLRDGPFGAARRVAFDPVVSPGGLHPSGQILLDTSFNEAAIWDPEVMTTAEMVLALVRNGVSIRRQPEMALPAFTVFAAFATGFRGPRGGYREVISWVERQLT